MMLSECTSYMDSDMLKLFERMRSSDLKVCR